MDLSIDTILDDVCCQRDVRESDILRHVCLALASQHEAGTGVSLLDGLIERLDAERERVIAEREEAIAARAAGTATIAQRLWAVLGGQTAQKLTAALDVMRRCRTRAEQESAEPATAGAIWADGSTLGRAAS